MLYQRYAPENGFLGLHRNRLKLLPHGKRPNQPHQPILQRAKIFILNLQQRRHINHRQDLLSQLQLQDASLYRQSSQKVPKLLHQLKGTHN